jgi:uncharacterized protein
VVSVVVAVDQRGNLVSAEATGHAGTGKIGHDIACAAVTVLLRTTMTALSGPDSGVEVEATTAGRGTLAFRVVAAGKGSDSLLRYAAGVLREALGSLSREYPDSVALTIRLDKLED